MIYLICFLVSTLFAYFARKTKNRSMCVMLSIFSIMTTVLLAGFRAVTVGIDTSNYYAGSWTTIMRFTDMPFGRMISTFMSSYKDEIGFLYGIILGVTAKYTGNFNVFLTVVHLIIITGIYIGFFRFRDIIPSEFGLFVFYLLYYGNSLNIFRQYLAMAVLFAFAKDIFEKRYIRYFIVVVISTLLHSTGFLGILPMVIHLALYSSKSEESTLFKKALVCLLIIGGTVAFLPLFEYLVSSGILGSRWNYYLEAEEASSYKLSFMFILVELVAIGIFITGYVKRNYKADYFLFATLAYFCLMLIATSLSYGKRMATYLSCINIMSILMLIKSQPTKMERAFVKSGIIVVTLIYFGYVYMYRNANEIFPYIAFWNY